MFYRPFVLFRLFQRQILFQREARSTDGEGVVPAHIPPVPRLEHHAGGGLTLLRPAQDEAVLCGIGFQPLIGTGVGEAGVAYSLASGAGWTVAALAAASSSEQPDSR